MTNISKTCHLYYEFEFMIDTKGITSKLSQLSVDRLNNFSDDEFFEFLGDVLSAKELLMNCSFDAFILVRNIYLIY